MAIIELRILCIGNQLHGNDGAGHAVFEKLQQVDLPNHVELLDGGIGGLTLLPFFKDVQQVLLVDLAKTDHPDGQIFWIKNASINLPEKTNLNGEHGGDLTTLLTMLPIYLDTSPDIDLVCISASTLTHFDPSLDGRLEKSVNQTCEQIQTYIASHYKLPIEIGFE